jgi:NADPH-dependent ferric siderophore reductase
VGQVAGGRVVTAPVTPQRPGRRAPTFHHATVAAISSVTPRMRRIELSGAELTGYPCDGPGAHLKLLLPPPGSREILLPSAGRDGLRWPDGPRPLTRTYTPRRVDGGEGRLAIDFALHDDGGPATAWAGAAQQGEQVVVSGARGAYRIGSAVPGAEWTLLVADETALPGVATILEDAPASARVLVIAEVAGPGEELSFGTAAGLTVTWLYRGSGVPAGMLAAAAVRDADLPAGRGAFWAGLEAGAMRAVRRHLLDGRGAGREQLYTRAYWKRGVANHPDHDTGEDE